MLQLQYPGQGKQEFLNKLKLIPSCLWSKSYQEPELGINFRNTYFTRRRHQDFCNVILNFDQESQAMMLQVLCKLIQEDDTSSNLVAFFQLLLSSSTAFFWQGVFIKLRSA